MVRAKFTCYFKQPNSEGLFNIKMQAVTSESEENEKFFKYTPYGILDLGVLLPETAEKFEVGKSYYLDFTPVD